MLSWGDKVTANRRAPKAHIGRQDSSMGAGGSVGDSKSKRSRAEGPDMCEGRPCIEAGSGDRSRDEWRWCGYAGGRLWDLSEVRGRWRVMVEERDGSRAILRDGAIAVIGWALLSGAHDLFWKPSKRDC